MFDDKRPQFRIMPGLPPYGPLAISFPRLWGRSGQEGLVVEFCLGDSARWIGNFRPGLACANRVLHHPDQRRVLVLSSGTLWVVDIATQTAEEIALAIDDLWGAPGSGDIILSRQGLALFRLGPNGIVWHTRRLSWDGFSQVTITSDSIRGLA